MESPKKLRFRPRLLDAARSGVHIRDVHVFIGGTGAVGGTTLFKALDLYEEMFAYSPPTSPEDVPMLVATGASRAEIRQFRNRLFRSEEAKHGVLGKPLGVRDGHLTLAGIYVVAVPFQLSTLDGLDEVAMSSIAEHDTAAQRLLERYGILSEADAECAREHLIKVVSEQRPMATWLAKLRDGIAEHRSIGKFRSVTIGIPLPSLLAYHQGALDKLEAALAGVWGGVAHDLGEALRTAFRRAVMDDLLYIGKQLSDNVLIAHTTAVGGMYDVIPTSEGGANTRRIRLGFAHSARDELLVEKQRHAEELTRLFAGANAKVLISAAAIGIDSVRIDEPIPLNKSCRTALDLVADVPFRGPRPNAQDQGPAGRVLRCRPIEVGLERGGTVGTFEMGPPLRPRFALRSGENGLFSVANADSLYRTMRVATVSELGFILASVAILGDDPVSPWFPNNVCYYTESDNSRPLFGFMYQPALLDAQLSGLEPMALQDLGSAKHQAELHLLALLILMHRLRSLDWDAIESYPVVEAFDARRFLIENSRPLTFTDVERWNLADVSADLRILASADEPNDLLDFAASGAPWGVFPSRDEARNKVLRVALEAVWNAPALGSPYVYHDRNGELRIRTGWFVAPLERVVGAQYGIGDMLYEDWESRQVERGLDFQEYVDLCIAVNGFVDIRTDAVICRQLVDRGDMRGTVTRCANETELDEALASLDPYLPFAATGLLVVMHRLQAIAHSIQRSMLELGTQQDWVWQIPRDSSGHALVVPGIIEALRMSAEGLEKTTGTEWLDGPWKYFRPRPQDRRELVGKSV